MRYDPAQCAVRCHECRAVKFRRGEFREAFAQPGAVMRREGSIVMLKPARVIAVLPRLRHHCPAGMAAAPFQTKA